MASTLLAQSDGPARPWTLDDYEWKNRVLIVFAPDTLHAAYGDLQVQLEQDHGGFAERDLVLIQVLDGDLAYAGKEPLQPADARRLRDRFNVAMDSFVTILLGKDGTEKARQRGQADLAALYALIDTMPMRQREMQRQRDR
ncbi:MAG: DUF4174 domain-containing protein [Bacteroidota bacterium]